MKWLLTISALVFVVFGIGFDVYTVYGQSRRGPDPELLQYRLNSVVAHQTSMEIDFNNFKEESRRRDLVNEARLTKLETTSESNTNYLRAIMGAVFAMAGKELLASLIAKRKQRRRNNDDNEA